MLHRFRATRSRAALSLVALALFTFAGLVPARAQSAAPSSLSPKERADDLMEKVNDFRSANTPLIWVIHPRTRQATVYRADGTSSLLTDPAELSGEAVLPGFTLPLAAVLPPAAPHPAPPQ